MNVPSYDFHIHTKHLKCADNTMEIKSIVNTCESLGITKLAITDHLNNFERIDDHLLIAEDIKKLDTDVEVYFGVELNYMGYDGEFAYNDEIRDRVGFQFAIGGIHDLYVDEYDPQKIIDIQHMHHLKACKNPFISVVVHPYWLPQSPFVQNKWPVINPLKLLPESYIKELGQVSKETCTAIELNAVSCLANTSLGEEFPSCYEEFIGVLASEGAVFSFGSDAHNIASLEKIKICLNLAKKLNLDEQQIWEPDFEPLNAERIKNS